MGEDSRGNVPATDATVAGDSRAVLMVGFNRRFAPQVVRIKESLSGVTAPKSFVMTVNAGEIPADHWTQDLAVGGGRIIGEASPIAFEDIVEVSRVCIEVAKGT